MVFFLGFLAPPNFFAQAKRFDASDLRKIVRVSDPQISPDGKSIVCVVSRANYDENRFEPELVLIDVATRAQKVLIAKRKNLALPRWSPDGNALAFIAATEAGTAQIFITSANGGEERKLTDAPKGVEQFAWKSDSKDIAFVAPDAPAERKGGERFNDAFEVGDNDYLTRESPMPSHLWLISTNGGEARRLTSGAWTVQKGTPLSASPISWSPDGKSLLFIRTSTPFSGSNDSETVVEILDLASSEIRQLTAHKNYESFAKYSPDGSRIFYAFLRDEKSGGDDSGDFYVTSSDGKRNTVDLTKDIDRQMRNAVWMPGGKSILFGGHDETRTSLWLQSVDGAKARRLNLGAVSPNYANYYVDANVGANASIAFVGTTAKRPAEVFYMSSPDAALQQLTHFQDEFINSVEFGKSETIEWQTDNRMQTDGVLIYPPNFDSLCNKPESCKTTENSSFRRRFADYSYGTRNHI